MAAADPVIVALIVAASVPAAAASDKKTITAAEARDNIGQDVTVCGKVVAVQKAFSRSGGSWLLRIDEAAPPVFTVMMPGNTLDNPAFLDADRLFADKDICATGRVRDYNGMVHIQLTAPAQIKIVKRPAN
jgi:hypothetical protein